MTVRRIYHDWEFVEDGRTIAPLSVGMVADNGDELYRVIRDNLTVGRAFADPWLREHVVPHLPVRRMNDGWAWDCNHPDYVRVRTRAEVAQDVRFFVDSHGPDVDLWGDWAAYDHVCLAQMYGRMVDLPQGLPMYTNDLRQELARLGFREDNVHLLPKPDPSHEHSAIHDARHEWKVGDFLLNWEANWTRSV